MKRGLTIIAVAAVLLAVMASAGAAPGGVVPVTAGSTELSFTGTLTVTGFGVLHKQPSLEGALNGPLSSSNGGVEADLSDLPVQLPLEDITATCQSPQVTITTQATSIPIPGFADIALGSLTLVRPVDPADTALVDQVCQAADDLDNQPGKLKGRRLAEAVDALNALGGTWQLVAGQPPATE
jgi:hypothetical protein